MKYLHRSWKNVIATAVLTTVLFLLYFSNWQSLIDSTYIRFILSYSAFIVPGFSLSILTFYKFKLLDYFLSHVIIGFGISLSLVTLLGIPALIFNWPFIYIYIIMSSLSIFLVNIIVWYRLSCNVTLTRFSNSVELFGNILIISSAIVAITFVLILMSTYNINAPINPGNLSGGVPGNTDNALYNAYVTEYQHSTQLSISEAIYNSNNLPYPRHYFHPWPMAQALIVLMADVNILQVYYPQVIVLGLIAASTVFLVARAFNYSKIYAVLAATIHLSIMPLLLEDFQPGQLFFFRINQDKFLFMFVFANILLAVFRLHTVLPTKRTYAVYMMVVIASVIIHPTSPIFMGLILGIYLFFRLIMRQMHFSEFTKLLIPWMIAALIVIGIRLIVPDNIDIATMVTDETISELNEVSMERNEYRLTFINESLFYAVNWNVWGSPIFIAYFLAVILIILITSKLDLINDFTLYIIIISSLILSLLVPYTAWLIGAIVTPFHIWRFLAYTPFGLTFMYLIYTILQLGKLSDLRSKIVICLVCTLCAGVSVYKGMTGPSIIRPFPDAMVTSTNLRILYEYAYLGNLIDNLELQSEQVVVIELPTRNQVPSISSRTVPINFRSTVSAMVNQTGTDVVEATRQINLYRDLIDIETLSQERRDLLLNSNIDYVIWMQNDISYEVLYQLEPVMELIYEGNYLSLYRAIQD